MYKTICNKWFALYTLPHNNQNIGCSSATRWIGLYFSKNKLTLKTYSPAVEWRYVESMSKFLNRIMPKNKRQYMKLINYLRKQVEVKQFWTKSFSY